MILQGNATSNRCLILALVCVMLINAGYAVSAQNRYVGYAGTEPGHIEIRNDTLAVVYGGFGLMSSLHYLYKMVPNGDSVSTLHSVTNSEHNGVDIAPPGLDTFENCVLRHVSDHEIILQPAGLPFVKETWLEDELPALGMAVVYDDRIIKSNHDLERLQSVANSGKVSMKRLSGKEAYNIYGAIGVRGALVFVTKGQAYGCNR